MKFRIAALLGMASLLVGFDASAQRIRLSDSLSPQQNYSMDLSWQPQELNQYIAALLQGGEGPFPPMRGFLSGVEIRLYTADYVGQNVRIYLVLPSIVADPSAGTLQLSWESSGVFLPGSVRAGQETLLFEGMLENEVTVGTFNFMLQVEGGGTQNSLLIEPYYELEVLL